MAGNSWHVYGVEITLLSSYVSRMLNFRAATEYSDTRMIKKYSDAGCGSRIPFFVFCFFKCLFVIFVFGATHITGRNKNSNDK